MHIDFTTREGRRAQGKLLQQAAEDAGLSLEALAREIGCSRALIYQYVSGATLAQPDRIQQIAACTGKPLLYFYGGDAAPNNLQERVFSLQALLTAQVSPPDLSGAISTCEQLIALAREAGEVRAEAGARMRLAGVLLQQGETARALTLLEQTIPFLRQHHLETPLLAAEQNRGHALLALGRVEEAEACFTRVVAGGEWSARWQGAVSLAAVAEYRGQYFRALERLDEALALVELAPEARAGQVLRLYVHGNLANVHLACGDHQAAMQAAEEARELAVQLSNRDQYTEALLTIGVCQRLRGDLPQSRATLESAARWARLADDKGREALALAELAETLVACGRFDDARLLGKEALQQGIATGTRRAELTAQLALAAGYQRAGLPQDARYHAAQAWEISTLIGQPCAQAQALVTLGEVHWARGDHTEAHRAFVPAYDLAESIGARQQAVQAALGLARLGEALDLEMLLAQARALASPALLWPVQVQCGRQCEDAGDLDAAARHYQQAIATLATLRRTLAVEPAGDTYLEYPLACEPYRRLAQLARLRGDSTGAQQLLSQAEWPPLDAVLEDVV